MVRDWQVAADDPRAKCTLFLYFRPSKRASGDWVLDWGEARAWIGFYTNAEIDAENAYAVSRACSSRWGIEILNKRDTPSWA